MELKTIDITAVFCNDSVIIPTIIAWVRFRNFDSYYRLYAFLLLLYCIFEFVFLFKYNPQQNNVISYLLFYFETMIFIFMYLKQIQYDSIKKILILFTCTYILFVFLEIKLMGWDTYRASVVGFLTEIMECLILTKVFLLRIFRRNNNKAIIEWLLAAPLLLVIFNLAVLELFNLFYFYYTPIDPPNLPLMNISLFLLNLIYNITTTIALLWIPAKPRFLKAS